MKLLGDKIVENLGDFGFGDDTKSAIHERKHW